MMEEEEYKELLDRAWQRIPTGFHDTERWKIPTARLEYEGKNTIIANLKEMVDDIKRDEKHLFKYIQEGVGAAGEIKGNKGVLKGKQKQTTIDHLINNYCEMFVLCKTCGKPDTTIIKEGRSHVLACQACGTRRPVKL
jgi:translation initiation factor 2 subunit 2